MCRLNKTINFAYGFNSLECLTKQWCLNKKGKNVNFMLFVLESGVIFSVMA